MLVRYSDSWFCDIKVHSGIHSLAIISMTERFGFFTLFALPFLLCILQLIHNNLTTANSSC